MRETENGWQLLGIKVQLRASRAAEEKESSINFTPDGKLGGREGWPRRFGGSYMSSGCCWSRSEDRRYILGLDQTANSCHRRLQLAHIHRPPGIGLDSFAIEQD